MLNITLFCALNRLRLFFRGNIIGVDVPQGGNMLRALDSNDYNMDFLLEPPTNYIRKGESVKKSDIKRQGIFTR
jgi:hypothetical protein